MSPLGFGLAETSSALRTGRDGIRPVDLFPTDSFRAKTAGLVPRELTARIAGSAASAWPRAAQLLLLAVEEALASRPEFVPDVVVAATTSGGMDFGERFYRMLPHSLPGREARRLVRRYVPHQPALDVLGVFGFHPPVRVVSNACASGTNALGIGARLIRSGQAARVLVLGFDAMAEMVFAGFDALQASTPEKCRPFDRRRSGLALGEGAAAFLLEGGEAASTPLAFVSGYGCANDNFHLTKPDPQGTGPRLSMQRALADSGLTASAVDYINAHGTGTPFNDASEAAAIRDVCPAAPVSSTKALTGHALGAAGAIEAAFCILAMQEGFLPPNINLEDPEPDLDLIANHARPARPARVLSNSFGFGGSNATILLEAA